MLTLSRPAAVKTGTTTDWRDNWTVGYTPDLVGGVWVGNADNTPMLGVSGVSGAGPIWRDVMEMAHKGLPARSLPPAGRPGAGRGVHRFGPAAHAVVHPAAQRAVHRRHGADATSTRSTGRWPWTAARGGLAGPETTPECREQRVLRVYPPELREWALAQGIEQPVDGEQ